MALADGSDAHHEPDIVSRCTTLVGVHDHARIAEGGALDREFTRKGRTEEESSGVGQLSFWVEPIRELVGMLKECLRQVVMRRSNRAKIWSRLCCTSSSCSSKTRWRTDRIATPADRILHGRGRTSGPPRGDCREPGGRESGEPGSTRAMSLEDAGGIRAILHRRQKCESRLGSLVEIGAGSLETVKPSAVCGSHMMTLLSLSPRNQLVAAVIPSAHRRSPSTPRRGHMHRQAPPPQSVADRTPGHRRRGRFHRPG